MWGSGNGNSFSRVIKKLASTNAGEGASLIGRSVEIVASKAAAAGIVPTTDHNLFVQGDGGGMFYAATGYAAGTYVDDGVFVILPTGGDGSAAWLRSPEHIVDVTRFEGADLSIQMQNAFNVTSAYLPLDAGFVLFIPPKYEPGGDLAYRWSQTVDISRNAYVEIRTAGMVQVKATVALNSFIDVGISNKNDICAISGLSADSGGFTHGAFIRQGAGTLNIYSRINLKDDSGGGFADGIVLDDTLHTGTEAGAGHNHCVVDEISTNGTQPVTGAIVRSNGLTDVTIRNIRGRVLPAGTPPTHLVKLVASDSSVANCTIDNITGKSVEAHVYLEQTLTKLLQSNHVGQITGTSKRAVQIVQTGTGLIIDNQITPPVGNSANWTVQKLVIPSGPYAYRNRIGFLSENAGDPTSTIRWNGEAGDGLAVWDTSNRSLNLGVSNTFEQILPKKTISLADGTASFIAIPPVFDKACLVSVMVEDTTANYSALIWARAESGVYAACDSLVAGPSVDTATGILSGTTGVAGKVTISTHTDGNLYVENRTGGTRQISISVLS